MPIPTTIVGLAWAVAAYILYIFIASSITTRQNAVKARRLDCHAPPELKSRYPMGAYFSEQQFPLQVDFRVETSVSS